MIAVNRDKCPHNHVCPLIKGCPVDAISQGEDGYPIVDHSRCIECGKCVRNCFMGAMVYVDQDPYVQPIKKKEEDMIAITSEGNTLDSCIDSRFGRCSYFAFYDTATRKVEFVANPNKTLNEGAGPASASFVASRQVKTVYAGEFGGKVRRIFEDLGIRMVAVEEDLTIQEIIHAIETGEEL